MLSSLDEFDYTLVVGVDKKHLDQLRLTFPTWIKHKPSLLSKQMIVFFDRYSNLKESEIREVVKHRHLRIIPWPFDERAAYRGDPSDKFKHPQRYKMLSGFVHVPAIHVDTNYWLKLDTDVVATEFDDWIDMSWFKKNPAIVAHRWSFTKPANQILELDAWVDRHSEALRLLSINPPLDLRPATHDADRITHERIISWCGFFSTTVTRLASTFANQTVGYWQLPVPSQDGFLWYISERMGFPIIRAFMKGRGWEQWCTMRNIENAAQRAMVNFHG